MGSCIGRPKQQYCLRGHDRTLPGALNKNNDCIECARIKSAEYHRAHPERTRQRHRKALLREYGIDQDFYDYLYEQQHGRCKICGNVPRGKEKWLCVDHDHATGKVRGLLCGSCNRMLGLSYDNPETLRKAADYLENQ